MVHCYKEGRHQKAKKKTEHFRVCSDHFVKGELIIYFDLCQPEL